METKNMRVCPSCLTRTGEIVCPKDGYRTVEERFFKEKEKDPLIEQVFDNRYRITNLIGRGGMGSVYKAVNIAMNQTVALKVMNRELVEDINQVKRFHQEAMASSRLNHPHTIKVFDFGQSEEGLLFIAMEFLNGKTLTRVLKEQGKIDPLFASKIAYQVGQSLVEAHELGIIHRDLKPDNIFLIEVVGEDVFIKVLDFGIAKFLSSGSGEMNLTKTGIIVGTPRYMSPEQARGEKLDFSSDLYSLGVILYEMVSGIPPFTGDTPMAMLMSHISKPPPPFAFGLVPEDLEKIIFKCLAKEQSERFPSTRKFLSALINFIKSMEKSTIPVSTTTTEASMSLPPVDKQFQVNIDALETKIEPKKDTPSSTPRQEQRTADYVPSFKLSTSQVKPAKEEEKETVLLSSDEIAKSITEKERKLAERDKAQEEKTIISQLPVQETLTKSSSKYIFIAIGIILILAIVSMVLIQPWKEGPEKDLPKEPLISAVTKKENPVKEPEPAKIEPVQQPVVKEEKKTMLNISFDSEPQEADVFTEKGEKLGITPFKKEFEPSENSIKFAFKKEGYKDEVVTAYLKDGLKIELNLTAEQEQTKKTEPKKIVETKKTEIPQTKPKKPPAPKEKKSEYKGLKEDDDIEYKGLK